MNLRFDTLALKNIFRQCLSKKVAFFLMMTLGSSALAQTSGSLEDTKKQANKLFEAEDYGKAYKLYSQLVSNYPKDAEYNYRLGVCMIYSEPNKAKSIPYLTFAANNIENAPKEANFYLGKAYHINYRFDDAIKYYKEYTKTASSSQLKKTQVEREITACHNGKRLLSNLSDLVITGKKQLNEADYYRSYDLKNIGGKLLVKPEEFKTATDKKKKDKSVVFIPKGSNTVYFSSYGDNDQNGKDIYTVSKTADGTYGKPQRLQGINTPYDEDYPFMHPDGKTLYFSSKGYNSMGGYDIFKSTYNENTNSWSAPVNLEFPINSPDDDFLFVTDSLEQIAYFSTGRQSPQGKIDVLKIKTERRPIDFLVIKGTVTKESSEQNVNSVISIKNEANKLDVGTFNAEDNGDYTLELPNGATLLFTVETPGQKTQTQKVSLPKINTSKAYRQLISYESGVLQIKNYFDETSSDDDYLQYLSLIEKKAKLDVNGKDDSDEKRPAATTQEETETAENNVASNNTTSSDNSSSDNSSSENNTLSNEQPNDTGSESDDTTTAVENKEKEIETAEKLSQETQAELDVIKETVSAKENELAVTKRKIDQDELKKFIDALKSEQTEKEKQLAETNADIEKLNEELLVLKSEANMASGNKAESNSADKNYAKAQRLNKQGDELQKKANALKNTANTKSGTEKQNLLNEARNIEDKATEKYLQAADITKQDNATLYKTNASNVEVLLKSNPLSGTQKTAAKRLSDEANTAFKQAAEMRQEAQTLTSSAKLGALSNAEEKEAEAILKQQQAIDILAQENSNTAQNPAKQTAEQDKDFVDMLDEDIVTIATQHPVITNDDTTDDAVSDNNSSDNTTTTQTETKTTSSETREGTSSGINPDQNKDAVLSNLEKEHTTAGQVADYFSANKSTVRNRQANTTLNNAVSQLQNMEEESKRIDTELKNYTGSSFSGSVEEMQSKASMLRSEGENLDKQAADLRAEAKTKTGSEKEQLLQTAKNTEGQAQSNMLQVASINRAVNDAEYEAANKTLAELMVKLKTDKPSLYADLQEKVSALQSLNNQVQDLYTESMTMDDYASRLGNMSNAEDKAALLLQNQAEIMEELLREYPNYEVETPETVEVNNEQPPALLKRKKEIREKQHSELGNITNALSLEYETSKSFVPKNLSREQSKIKQVADELNAESKRLLMRSAAESNEA
ncbi:MAG: PD40 domain-containing protein, partial [Bacteroidetes bacterium]|nr:PD40 domain-containing protein [Bacteroidota bacterium]